MGIRRIRRETWSASKSQRFVVVWSPFEAYTPTPQTPTSGMKQGIHRSLCMPYAMGGDQKMGRGAARGSGSFRNRAVFELGFWLV